MRALGIDAGPSMSGFAFVDVTGPKRTFVRGGKVPSTAAGLAPLLTSGDLDLVGIERIQRVFGQVHASPLLDTARVEGFVAGLCESLNIRVEYVPSAIWRKFITGSRTPSDATVASALTQHVKGMPQRSNCHVRDALGVALYVAMLKAKAA